MGKSTWELSTFVAKRAQGILAQNEKAAALPGCLFLPVGAVDKRLGRRSRPGRAALNSTRAVLESIGR